MLALLGRPTSLLLVAVALLVALLVTVRPVLESLMFPELSTILVLDAPELPLTADELRDVRPLCADLLTVDLPDVVLFTPDLDDAPLLVLAILDRPLPAL